MSGEPERQRPPRGDVPADGAADDGEAQVGEDRERTVEVRNRHGLHARPAAEFVKLASGFDAEVMVEKDGLEVNGKSIMGVLMLAAEQGATLTLRASGDDAGDALDALSEFLRTEHGDELAEGEG